MKALIQRVDRADVSVSGEVVGKITKGLCVFLGVVDADTQKDIQWLAEKIVNLRIFDDDDGRMNLSLRDVSGEMLLISQFTLCGDCRKGRRPSWAGAAKPDFAKDMYEKFIEEVRKTGVRTETGIFQAEMKVSICNDGPVTLMIDSKE
jgi:D-aminoacyl-tRNA deacylase